MLRATPRDPPGAYPRPPTLAGRQEAIPRCRGQRAMPPPDWLQICTPWVVQGWGGTGVKGTPGSRTRSAAAGEHRTGEDVGEAEPLTPVEPPNAPGWGAGKKAEGRPSCTPATWRTAPLASRARGGGEWVWPPGAHRRPLERLWRLFWASVGVWAGRPLGGPLRGAFRARNRAAFPLLDT